MPDIRVALKFQRFQLDYSGSLAFFERVVDPLLARWAPYPGREPHVGAASAAAPAGAGEAPASQAAAPSAAVRPRAGTPVPAAPVPVVPRGYRPTSAEFGAFVQKLGPEAGEPDRQLMAFAFYLWNYEKKDLVREDEVEGCFRALGLRPPDAAEALYLDLSQRLRFLVPGPQAGTWTLTSKGANYVKTRLLGAL